MPSIFKRISEVLTTNINDILDRVEDPQRSIRQMIREMEDRIAQAQEGVIDASVGEKRLQGDLAEHNRESQAWLQRAEEAIQAGRRDLARTALMRKKEHDHMIQTLEPSWETAKNVLGSLKTQLFALQAKLAQAKRMQAVWAARQRVAETQQSMERTLAKVHGVGALASSCDTFSQAVDKIKNMESKAKAIAETLNTNFHTEQDFLAIEMERGIENELTQLELSVRGKLLIQQEPALQEPALILKGAEAPSNKGAYGEND